MTFVHHNPKEQSKTDVTWRLMKSKKHITQNEVKKHILEEVHMLKETLEHYKSPETSEELKQEEQKE